MKKKFKIRLLASVLAVAPFTMIVAQSQSLIAAHWLNSSIGNTALATKISHDAKGKLIYIKAKVMRSFLMMFEGVTDVNWCIQNNEYLATFLKEEKLYRVLFESSGQMIYCIKWGTEATLPDSIRRMIKATYLNYTIGTVTDVYENGKKFWTVNLEDSKNLVVVRVTDGTLEELHHYKTHFQASK